MTVITSTAQPAQDKSLGMVVVCGLAIFLGLIIAAFGEKAIQILAFAVAFPLIIRYPLFGLFMTTALLLLSGSTTIIGDLHLRIPLTAGKVMGALTFVAWLMNALIRKERFRFSLALGFLICFFIWAGLSTVLATNFTLQWQEWFRLGTLVAYFILVIHLLDTPQRVHYFVMLVLVCCFAMAAYAVIQYFVPTLELEIESAIADVAAGGGTAYVDYETGAAGPAVRVSGGTGHSNWLAMIILVLMPLNVYWFMVAQSRRSRALALAAVAIELAALVLTFTRQGFLVGCILLILLGARNLLRVTPYRIVAVTFVIYLVFVFFLPDAYKSRVLNPAMYTQSESVQNRLELQQAAINITAENPIWGVGLGGYGYNLLEQDFRVASTMKWFVDEYDWPPEYIGAHNFYLQVASETGLVGLALLLAFFTVLLRNLHQAYNRFKAVGDQRGAALASTLEIGLISFLISAAFLHALHQKIWWMLAALAVVVPMYQYSVTVATKKAAQKAAAKPALEPASDAAG